MNLIEMNLTEGTWGLWVKGSFEQKGVCVDSPNPLDT